ncbi:galactose-binding lectin l-1-like isoform X2 [Anguilla anguilla]|uniref:galactose-binding lectin l-1-like isoform X2 n=2 Tax=Anguilla anguilla TaxID=7936 RepID=UPI0015B21A0F|nr:galactose-binding lectin l-1-like isoform X2 [Anguilla anguilla]
MSAIGRYRFLHMPYGISAGSEVFQRTTEQLFAGQPCEILVDDILVWGRNREEHDKRLKQNSGVNNISFMPGMKLWVKGAFHFNPQRFSINVGQDEQNIALHCDVRFGYGSSRPVIVMNSRENNEFGEEVRERNFPFQPEQEFEVTIAITDNTFHIILPGNQVLVFPDRLPGQSRNKIWVEGDATIHGISLR